MVFLFSIVGQWFSRGAFLQIFIQQEEDLFLISIFLGSVILSSPIQGYMSDLTSRKKVIVLALLASIISILIMLFGPRVTSLKFPIICGVAAVVNGVFGNVFPASGAGLSERTGEEKRSLLHSFLFRYLGLGVGALMPLPQMSKLLFAVSLVTVALLWVIWDIEDGEIVLDKS